MQDITTNRWLADADKIDISTFDINKYIAKTSGVNAFLDEGSFIISAPKGYGKTLLLKCVYQNLPRTDGSVRIPTNTPIDTFDYALTFDSKKLEYLSDSQTWDYMWQVGLGCSSILNYALATKDADYLEAFIDKLTEKNNRIDSLISLCNEILKYLKDNVGIPRYIRVQANPSSVMGLLMATTLGAIRSSIDWTLECIHQFCLGIDRPLFIFIDKIDQGVRPYPIDIWKSAQVGLVASIFRLHSSNRHIKIYASIRKEAWDSCEDELASQYEDYVCDLSYSMSDLREIFEHAIKTFETEQSVPIREKYATSPIESFVGMSMLDNRWGSQEEDPFFYMTRHSLRRPRDLILFGKEIHRLISGSNFDEDAFIDLVNRIPGEEIQRQYLKESLPFTSSLQHINTSLFFERIEKNVYTKFELIEICSRINSGITCIAKSGGDCRDCKGANHIFCDLYRIGLLGVVVRKETKDNGIVQHFEVPGVVRSTHLPESKYYLLHPAIDHYTKELLGNFSYSPVKGVIIGNGYKWHDNYDAILITSKIHELIEESAIARGSDIYVALEDLNRSILDSSDQSEISNRFEAFRTAVSSDGLLNSSQFIANITSAADMLSKLIST